MDMSKSTALKAMLLLSRVQSTMLLFLSYLFQALCCFFLDYILFGFISVLSRIVHVLVAEINRKYIHTDKEVPAQSTSGMSWPVQKETN